MRQWFKDKFGTNGGLSPAARSAIKRERVGYTERELRGFFTHWLIAKKIDRQDPNTTIRELIVGTLNTITRRLSPENISNWEHKAKDYTVKKEQLEVLHRTLDIQKALGV